MHWIVKDFRSLTVDELYAVLRLRSEIFVVEQQCVFQDMDNKDQDSFHLLGVVIARGPFHPKILIHIPGND